MALSGRRSPERSHYTRKHDRSPSHDRENRNSRQVATTARAGRRDRSDRAASSNRSRSRSDRGKRRKRSPDSRRASDRDRRSDDRNNRRDSRDRGRNRERELSRDTRSERTNAVLTPRDHTYSEQHGSSYGQADRSHNYDTQNDRGGRGGAPGGKGGGRGYGGGRGCGGRVLAPLPRPGYDSDQRLVQLEDDPRYFEGAELGKAQKAAMGIVGLTGRNTASFEPSSTLVRPAMRVFYGASQKRYGKVLKPDDVCVVPDFWCPELAVDEYSKFVTEAKQLQTNETLLLDDSPLCKAAVAKICKYFSIEEEGRGVRISWYPQGPGEKPFVREFGKTRKLPSKKALTCLAQLSVGATHELAFRRPDTGESLFLTQFNGGLSLFGRDACWRWEYGINATDAHMNGHISISVIGVCSIMEDEIVLKPAPSDLQRGEEAFNAPGQGNSVCYDLARPSMRIITVPMRKKYGNSIKHDDVIVVPEFCCAEGDWNIYYQMIQEMRDCQAQGVRKAEFISWHEGAHLLSQNPTGSKTFQKVIDQIAEYFSIAEGNRGTRFNWYRDGADWKPFHHDSAAFNEQRARTQNCTIGISFGEDRELAFRHAKTGELIYFPQKNGMLFYFGRDANIVWQHGINALPDSQQNEKGRISIVLWGLCTTAIDEEGAPPMLTDDSRKGKGGKGKGGGKGGFDMHGGKGSQPCRDFARGTCNWGDRCRFAH